MSTRVRGALVFTDLAGFTAFTAEHGDDAALQLVEQFEQLVVSLLPSDARIVKQLGDGFFLFFADVRSALAAATELAGHARHGVAAGIPLWPRTGVHFGVAVARGDDLFGNDVNIAARITDLAGADEILLSAAACAELDHDAPFDPVGPVFLKGIQHPVRLFRVAPMAMSPTGR